MAPRSIVPLAQRAKELGVGLVLVHGETIGEPVRPGTNRAAVECPAVDILAHPGLITLEEARLATANDIYLEITSHRGHCLTNGHVANIARQAGTRLVVNTDTHTPQDMIGQEMARRVAAGAGLNEAEIEAATVTNPQTLVQKAVGKG
jgi:histidinol phosphatase-like PHP family hydrolase